MRAWLTGVLILGSCVAQGLALAKYEPVKGCYLGAYIDFDPSLTKTHVDESGRIHHLPEEFEEVVGRPHAIYFYYHGYGHPLPEGWVRKLAEQGKFVHIALEPNQGMDKVRDDAYLRGLADQMRASGARIFLRFASEMNGDWTHYHRDAALYRRKFKLVHDVMAKRAPNVAMVWCPFAKPERLIPDYYPGNDAVDWVGVNFYSVTYHNQNVDVPADHEDPRDLLRFVYGMFASRKPIMICEYGVAHYSQIEGERVAAFAVDCIRKLYASLPTQFPRVKAINYFDSNNIDAVRRRENNDYTVTGDPDVLSAYQQAIASPYFLSAPEGAKVPQPILKPRPAKAIITLEICAETHCIATKYCPETIRKTFKRGTEPHRNCPKHHLGG